MKKIALLSLIFSLVFLFSSCSNNLDDNIDDSINSNAVEENKEVSEKSVEDMDKYYVESGITFEKGKKVPNFSVETLDGSFVSLDDFKGKYVVINFWATWCKYCKSEMPDLEQFQNEDFIILALDVEEPKDMVQKYIDDGGYSFLVGLDFDGIIAKEYGISAFPTSYFIDKDGNLVGVMQGMLTKESLEEIKKYMLENF